MNTSPPTPEPPGRGAESRPPFGPIPRPGVTAERLNSSADLFNTAIAAGLATAEPAGPRIDSREIADRTNTDLAEVARRLALLGLAEPDIGATVAHASIVEVFELFAAADNLLGNDCTDDLVRLLGEILGRLADALVSTFAVSLGANAHSRDASLGELTRENARFATLLPALVDTIDVVLRHHIEVARRPTAEVGYAGNRPSYESRRLAVGFADLTASTAMSERIDFAELSEVLTRFERIATETVASRGGRIVKLIGDGVMFAARTPSDACEIAAELLHRVAQETQLPPVRVGIASGDVLLRHGDCFGPVVNLAARLADHADPGSVAVPSRLAPTLPLGRLAAVRAESYTPRGSRHGLEIVIAVPIVEAPPPIST